MKNSITEGKLICVICKKTTRVDWSSISSPSTDGATCLSCQALDMARVSAENRGMTLKEAVDGFLKGTAKIEKIPFKDVWQHPPTKPKK